MRAALKIKLDSEAAADIDDAEAKLGKAEKQHDNRSLDVTGILRERDGNVKTLRPNKRKVHAALVKSVTNVATKKKKAASECPSAIPAPRACNMKILPLSSCFEQNCLQNRQANSSRSPASSA